MTQQHEPSDVETPPIRDGAFRPLLEKLSETYNFDFREYTEASLARRIRARMAQVRVDAFDAYARFLTSIRTSTSPSSTRS